MGALSASPYYCGWAWMFRRAASNNSKATASGACRTLDAQSGQVLSGQVLRFSWQSNHRPWSLEIFLVGWAILYPRLLGDGCDMIQRRPREMDRGCQPARGHQETCSDNRKFFHLAI